MYDCDRMCITGHEPQRSLFGSSFTVRAEDEMQTVGGFSCQEEGRTDASEAMCLGLFARFFPQIFQVSRVPSLIVR